jgi:hypothetical protein
MSMVAPAAIHFSILLYTVHRNASLITINKEPEKHAIYGKIRIEKRELLY